MGGVGGVLHGGPVVEEVGGLRRIPKMFCWLRVTENNKNSTNIGTMLICRPTMLHIVVVPFIVILVLD